MRTLTLSLLSVVLLATIGLGWMFDNFYNKYAEQSKEQQKDAITVLEQNAIYPLGLIMLMEAMTLHIAMIIGDE